MAKVPGLPNSCADIAGRVAFLEAVQGLLEQPLPRDEHFLVLFDLDRFALINDFFGWDVGDGVLGYVAQALGALDSDHAMAVARIGNDEFGLLTRGLDDSGVNALVAGLRAQLADCPLFLEGVAHPVRASFGVVPLSHDASSAADQVAAGHVAQSLAKEDGGDRVVFSTDAAHRIQRSRHLMQWASRILEALEADAFVLYEQPIQALHGEPEPRDEKSEILVRLRLDDGSLALPGAFIPAAEKYALMFAVDKWVFGHALEAWVRRRSRHGHAPRISINLSSQSLMEPSLMNTLREGFDRTGVPCTAVCFEFTESMAIRNFDEVVNIANQLRDMGCSIALDDFGSGYATFDYLRRLPLDYLKIDGSIVEGIVDSEVNTSMVSGIQLVTRAMKLQTIGEFASSPSIVGKLRELGVHYGQGSSIGLPRPFDEGETIRSSGVDHPTLA